MTSLAGYQRKFLRGQAHDLKPVVIVGKEGLSGPVLLAIDQELDNHELIKVRFGGDQQEHKKKLASEIAAKLQCEQVGMLGHLAIYYRESPDADKRHIKVPRREEAVE